MWHAVLSGSSDKPNVINVYTLNIFKTYNSYNSRIYTIHMGSYLSILSRVGGGDRENELCRRAVRLGILNTGFQKDRFRYLPLADRTAIE